MRTDPSLTRFGRGPSGTTPAAGRTRVARQSDESGAVIILALVFLVAVSLIVTGLLTWVGTSLTASVSFASERTTETAATSAVNLAISQTRGTFSTQMLNASPPTACLASQPQTFDNLQVDVWCSMVWQPYSSATRTITYSACLTTQTTNAATCAATPLLQAIMTFDDYAPGIGTPTANPVQCNFTGYCGQSMSQNSWQWNPNVPTVSSISPTTATINGNNASTGQPQTVTITGNGFVQGSSVNFVQQTGPNGNPANTPSTVNNPAGVIVTIPASQVTWGGCSGPGATNCTLSVTAPAVTSGTDYFVTVTTPGGTSAYVPTQGGTDSDDFQYTTVTPVVSGISGPTNGSITGGGTITVNGSGFYNATNFAAQVWFVGGGTSSQGTNVVVGANGSLTVNVPPVSSPGSYYVQVDTIGGISTSTSALYTYGVQNPIVTSLSPSSGATGTQVTIYGGNFLNNSTVQLFLNNGGSPSGSGINVSAAYNSQSSITITIPSGLTVNAQYFPVVTLPSPYSSLASQTYNEPADMFTYT
jgi:hypothetical protein